MCSGLELFLLLSMFSLFLQVAVTMCASSCNFRFARLGFIIVLVYIGDIIFHNTKEVLKYEMGEIIFYLILNILQS